MRFVALKRILSHFFIIPEYRFESELSGPMDIRWEKGRLALNSQNANYSYNHLHTVMQKGLREVYAQSLPSGPILNLGMGAGSTICILREERKVNNEIISVEYDPKLIEVAKEYFNLDRFESHSVHCADAFDFMMKESGPYALIIIDLFKDRQVDERFLVPGFIQKCISALLPNGALLFNYIGAEQHPLEKLLSPEKTSILNIQENRLLIYRNTDKS